MCLNCGCNMPYNDMGEPGKNLVVDDVKKLVETEAAKGLTTDQAIENIVKTWGKVDDEDKQYKVA